MHMVIRAIVYAESKQEAIDKAKNIFEGLCENQHPFDYFTTFDQDGQGVSGKDRWGKLPVAVKTSTEAGQKLISEGMESTKQELFENLDRIRGGLAQLTNEDIFNEVWRTNKDENADFGLLRYAMYCAGQYKGPSIWLYDDDGEGIRNSKHLENVLSKWQELYKDKPNPNKNLDIWVIPADVHH